MRGISAGCILTLICVGLGFSSAAAEHLNATQVRHADKNRDGIVDSTEMRREKSWERRQNSGADTSWVGTLDRNGDGRVDAKEKQLYEQGQHQALTPLEQQYDANHNGILEPEETKELLKDKYTLIKTHGKAAVDTPIEAAYDLNKDGIIDQEEAEMIREDWRLK